MSKSDAKCVYAGCISLLLLTLTSFLVNWQRGSYNEVSQPAPSFGISRHSYNWACILNLGGLEFGIRQYEGLEKDQVNTAIIIAGAWISFPFGFWAVLLIVCLPFIAALLLPGNSGKLAVRSGEGVMLACCGLPSASSVHKQ
jgi:hypothetical protein